MRRILAYAAIVLVIGAFVVITGAFSGGPSDPTYKLEFDNAFGLVPTRSSRWQASAAGKITSIELGQETFHAFAADATDILQVLDVQHLAVVRLVENGGTVFGALGQPGPAAQPDNERCGDVRDDGREQRMR